MGTILMPFRRARSVRVTVTILVARYADTRHDSDTRPREDILSEITRPQPVQLYPRLLSRSERATRSR